MTVSKTADGSSILSSPAKKKVARLRPFFVSLLFIMAMSLQLTEYLHLGSSDKRNSPSFQEGVPEGQGSCINVCISILLPRPMATPSKIEGELLLGKCITFYRTMRFSLLAMKDFQSLNFLPPPTTTRCCK